MTPERRREILSEIDAIERKYMKKVVHRKKFKTLDKEEVAYWGTLAPEADKAKAEKVFKAVKAAVRKTPTEDLAKVAQVVEKAKEAVEKPTIVIPVTDPEALAEGYKVRHAPNPNYKEPELPLTEDLDVDQTLELLGTIKNTRSNRYFRDSPSIAHARANYNSSVKFKKHMKEIFEKGQEQYREDMKKLRGKRERLSLMPKQNKDFEKFYSGLSEKEKDGVISDEKVFKAGYNAEKRKVGK